MRLLVAEGQDEHGASDVRGYGTEDLEPAKSPPPRLGSAEKSEREDDVKSRDGSGAGDGAAAAEAGGPGEHEDVGAGSQGVVWVVASLHP